LTNGKKNSRPSLQRCSSRRAAARIVCQAVRWHFFGGTGFDSLSLSDPCVPNVASIDVHSENTHTHIHTRTHINKHTYTCTHKHNDRYIYAYTNQFYLSVVYCNDEVAALKPSPAQLNLDYTGKGFKEVTKW
jgi:hypothetical protein